MWHLRFVRSIFSVTHHTLVTVSWPHCIDPVSNNLWRGQYNRLACWCVIFTTTATAESSWRQPASQIMFIADTNSYTHSCCVCLRKAMCACEERLIGALNVVSARGSFCFSLTLTLGDNKASQQLLFVPLCCVSTVVLHSSVCSTSRWEPRRLACKLPTSIWETALPANVPWSDMKWGSYVHMSQV